MRFVLVVAASVALALASCGGGPDDSWSIQTGIARSAHPFDGPWPFTVDHATLICRGDSKIVTLEVSGTTYALNDAARERGYVSPAAITRPGASLESVAQAGESICGMGGPGAG